MVSLGVTTVQLSAVYQSTKEDSVAFNFAEQYLLSQPANITAHKSLSDLEYDG